MKKCNNPFRMSLLIIFFTLGTTTSYVDIASGIEGETLPDAITGTAEFPYLTEPLANAIVINFDDLENAPCNFADKALRDLYADQGVSFDSPNALDGGAILDECSNFGVTGYSPPNFLAFNTQANYAEGGTARGPEIIYFDPPVSQVQVIVGAPEGPPDGEIKMEAYVESNPDQPVDTDKVNYSSLLQTLSVQASEITKVIVSFNGQFLVLDNLAFVQEKGWGKAYAAMLDSTSDLDMLRAYRDEILSKKARGRLYKRLLYKNSEDALEVLLDNPELLMKARDLIEANKDAVFDVLNGDVGVIYNTDEIIAFLKAFGKKSPRRLKALTKLVRKGMLRKKRKGRLFLGFELK